MRRIRVIPVLLLSGERVVKTQRFRKPVYVGDPINTVRLFNDKEVDELIVLDIDASKENRSPNMSLIETLAGECFMPLCYGGGISSLEQMDQLFRLGIEKVSLNTALNRSASFVSAAVSKYGSQALVASIDVEKSWYGSRRVRGAGRMNPGDLAVRAEEMGFGEVLLTDVTAEGTGTGMNTALVRSIADKVNIPLVAHGGAASLDDIREAVTEGGASAVAAGSMFVFKGQHRAVLVNYPSQERLVESVFARI